MESCGAGTVGALNADVVDEVQVSFAVVEALLASIYGCCLSRDPATKVVIIGWECSCYNASVVAYAEDCTLDAWVLR